jgi:hypothetical protein
MNGIFHRIRFPLTFLLAGLVILALLPAGSAAAQTIDQPAFQRLWQRTDEPVKQGRGNHSWIWGPQPFTATIGEWYIEGPGQSRAIQYFDKGRMEINNPAGNPNDPWYVTSGLLTRDMIDGRVQIGNGDYVVMPPAPIPVAGDPTAGFPTYADLRPYVRAPQRFALGAYVTDRLTPSGKQFAPEFAGLAAAQITHVVPSNYGVPKAFWDFLNQSGTIYTNGRFTTATPLIDWLYVAGYPIGDAFWVRVPVAGVQRDIMVQPFERRLLTYNPANPPRYQVEMGNVGLHYYRWRYEIPFAQGNQAVITAPPGGSMVESPLIVQGFENGTAFEAGIGVRLRSITGQIIARGYTMVHRPDILIPGPFSLMLEFPTPSINTPAVVEVFTSSPRDGSISVIASQPVTVRGLSSGVDAAIALVRDDLSARTGVPETDVAILSVAGVNWDSNALGCPAPGQYYDPTPVPGFNIKLAAYGIPYDYRIGQGEQFVLCQDGLPRSPIGAPFVVPARNTVSSLPIHIEAHLGRPGDQVNVTVWLTDGPVYNTNATLLAAPDGVGLLITSLWPPANDWANFDTQRAMIEIREPLGPLVAARQFTYVGAKDPNTRAIELYWLVGEELRAETRRIPQTSRIGTAALEELLWGPPSGSGFSTAIPTPADVLNYPGREPDWGSRVRLLSLTIQDGVATADFSQELRAYGGGSARVGAISNQIMRTLKQFPTVREVRIAIEGQTEGVLEP